MFSGLSVAQRKQKRFLFIGLTLLLLSLACGKTAPTQTPPPVSQTQPPVGQTETFEPGDSTRFLSHGGMERSYILHVPVNYDPSRPTALVLAFHGLGLNAEEMIRISGFSEQADTTGFIVVYPNGTGETSSWNGGHCCGEAAINNVDDVGFVRALIEELSASIDIDPDRIYATGFSNGAILTYRLACELSDLLAAVSPVSATPAELDMQACAPDRPVPLIHFHGTADDPNPYYGGELPSGFYFLPVGDTMQFWVANNGCPTQPQTTVSGSITHDVYAPCDSGSAVELYTITGGKHAWPGGEAVNQAMGEPNMEISATALMWEFFLSHPMP